MNARAKRKREKRRHEAKGHLLAAARNTYETRASEPYKHRYFDGKLVHEMIRDSRTFNRNYTQNQYSGSQRDWTTQFVFATRCGHVVAVGEPRYAFSKKPPTCIECLSMPRPRLSMDAYFKSISGRIA